MNSVQKAIFPGILSAIVVIIAITSLIAKPHVVLASTVAAPGSQPAASGATLNPAELQATGGLEKVSARQEGAGMAGACARSGAIPEAVRRWCEPIEEYAGRSGLDPILIAALITQESAGDPQAISHSGAVGLMQVMPRDGIAANFMCVAGPCFTDRPAMAELLDPEYNIQYGSQLLAGLLQRSGDLREALRAYGPRDRGYEYADLVLSIFNSYQ